MKANHRFPQPKKTVHCESGGQVPSIFCFVLLLRTRWTLVCPSGPVRVLPEGLKSGFGWERLLALIWSPSAPFVAAAGGNWLLRVAAGPWCCTAALCVRLSCWKLLQIIPTCVRSPARSSSPAPLLPSHFLSQNWTCGLLCVCPPPLPAPPGRCGLLFPLEHVSSSASVLLSQLAR